MKEVPLDPKDSSKDLFLDNITLGQLCEQLENNPSKLWDDIYRTFRNPFIYRAIQKYNCSHETASDIFHDSLEALYVNIKTLNTKQSQAPLKAYLYKIGDYKLINFFNKKALEDRKTNLLILPEFLNNPYFLDELHHHQQLLLDHLFCQLDQSSQTILRLFYFKNYCLDAIVHTMNYANVNVAKTRRLQAVRKLQKIIQTKHIKYEIFV